ncbi:uncharacterized protein PITG_08894 [Phytophthora infestans T30-4]|uniref:Uncharacterized protein n=1 Tax=Phytophthora infestans (strain T30-4) TaxID=403677 RepID=D0NDF9_PHYIT|nr:uncharacterized protein PITG_08894 [Phytophthora infestans T30-4]EEY56116.1 hypothetical protein PITG_08894 [Phytophthora infestans T30-4]|eukprot:XP_002902946.1 hypothetical protein PITG_08894 [Phytophthora infestans T30-4]
MTATRSQGARSTSPMTHDASSLVLSPIREQNESKEDDDSPEVLQHEDEAPVQAIQPPAGHSNELILLAEEFGRRLATMPHGVELLTLSVEDSHRRRLREEEASPRDPKIRRCPANQVSRVNPVNKVEVDPETTRAVKHHHTGPACWTTSSAPVMVELGPHPEKLLDKEMPLPKLFDNKKDFEKWKGEQDSTARSIILGMTRVDPWRSRPWRCHWT